MTDNELVQEANTTLVKLCLGVLIFLNFSILIFCFAFLLNQLITICI
jgi:hypothetical protein